MTFIDYFTCMYYTSLTFAQYEAATKCLSSPCFAGCTYQYIMKQENKKIIIIIGNDIRIMGNFLESVHALRNNWYKCKHIRLRSSMELEAKCRKFKVNSEYNM